MFPTASTLHCLYCLLVQEVIQRLTEWRMLTAAVFDYFRSFVVWSCCFEVATGLKRLIMLTAAILF
jgi:hypothetical protein